MSKAPNIPLSSFQLWMQQLLLDPHGQTETVAQHLLPRALHEQDLTAVIHDSKRLPAAEHLAIYQRSYIARLRECMAKQFSSLEYALGKELFCGFADNYLEVYPSSNYNLTHLGKNFATYLEANRPDKHLETKEDWPDFLIELARFEYAINVIFDEEADEDYISADETTPDDKLQLIPVFHLFEFQFPIQKYYGAFVNGQEPALPHPQKSYTVVMRHRYQLAMYDLLPAQFYFLKNMKEGQAVNQSMTSLLSEHKVDSAQLKATWPLWRGQWIKQSFFRIHVKLG